MVKLIFLLLTCSFYLWGSNSILPLNKKNISDFELLYYLDESNALGIEEIENIEFQQRIGNEFALGYQKGTLWFKITLNNPTPYNEFVLSLNEHFYETAQLYYYDTQWKKKQTGFFTPLSSREIQTSKLGFQIALESNSTQTLYLKLKGKYSYFGNITITPKETFFVHQFFTIELFYTFALGMVLMIILFNFFLWIKLKERIYGIYVGYTVSILIYLLTMSSFLVYLNMQEYTYKLNMSGPLASAFLALFSLELLKVKYFYKKLHYIILFIVIVLLFFSFLQSFYYTPWNAIISKTITVLNIILIVTAFMIYLKGQLHVKYYVFALMLFFIFIVLFVSMLSGTVNYNFITRYGYLFALCIEVVVFSLMLADRHNRTKNKQLQTQKELLALQNNQKKALEQEVENKTKRLCVLLSERELLLKEVFHRVKNNFHMITAFLWLESKKQGDAHCFDELINRIQSMSLIHEYLCHNESLTQIDSNKYLQELVTILTKSYKNIDISFDIDSFIINFDDIISLSVILNELISNSVKHNSHVALHLHIQCKLKEKHIIEFCLQDNGKGFENTKVKKGFGLRLIDDFVQKLPQAKATFHTQEGTLFVLEFQQRKTDEVV